MDKKKVILTKENETLLVPLYCRYLESRKPSPIIRDEKAIEIVQGIDYDFDRLEIPKQTYVTLCLRSKQCDIYAKHYLDRSPDSVFIQLGCGLDSRFDRVDNNKVEWFDLDFPKVIELRKQFYHETDRYHIIPSSVMELEWLENIHQKNKPVIILAEGLFMYVKEEEIKALFKAFSNTFSKSIVIFDCYSELTAKGIKNHPSIKKTGAVIHWGVDNAKDIESWGDNIHLIEEWHFTQSDDLDKLDPGYRFLFKIMGLFPIAKKAHRIVVVQLGT